MAKAPIRKPRKNVGLFCQEKIAYVDYKDAPLLRKFISDRGKIRSQAGDRQLHSAPAVTSPRPSRTRVRWRLTAVHEHAQVKAEGDSIR